jgi:acetoin utilization protein AcuB
MLVREWMSPNPVTVSPSQTLPEAVQIMKQGGFRRLPVIEQGKLVGIITDRDCKEAMPSDATSLSIWEINYLLSRIKVAEVMTPAPEVIQSFMPLPAAARIMLNRKVGGLPVVGDSAELVGIITVTDVLKAFLQQESQLTNMDERSSEAPAAVSARPL